MLSNTETNIQSNMARHVGATALGSMGTESIISAGNVAFPRKIQPFTSRPGLPHSCLQVDLLHKCWPLKTYGWEGFPPLAMAPGLVISVIRKEK